MCIWVSDQCCEFAWYFLISYSLKLKMMMMMMLIFVQRFEWKTSNRRRMSVSVSERARGKFKPSGRIAWYFDNNSNNKMYSVKTDIARRWTFVVDVRSCRFQICNIIVLRSARWYRFDNLLVLLCSQCRCFVGIHIIMVAASSAAAKSTAPAPPPYTQ